MVKSNTNTTKYPTQPPRKINDRIGKNTTRYRFISPGPNLVLQNEHFVSERRIEATTRCLNPIVLFLQYGHIFIITVTLVPNARLSRRNEVDCFVRA